MYQLHVSAAVLAKSYRRSTWHYLLGRSPWIEELASLNTTKSPQYTPTVHPLSPHCWAKRLQYWNLSQNIEWYQHQLHVSVAVLANNRGRCDQRTYGCAIVLGTCGINFVEHDEVPTVYAHRASYSRPTQTSPRSLRLVWVFSRLY